MQTEREREIDGVWVYSCVCVFVCERERERKEPKKKKINGKKEYPRPSVNTCTRKVRGKSVLLLRYNVI